MKILLAIPAIFLILIGVFFYKYKDPNADLKIIDNDFETISIELKGEIVFPGVYEIVKGGKLRDVIELAYGFTDNANISNINLNRVLNKSESVLIPSRVISESKKINLNKADFSELLTVPNITEKRAASILVYREQYGYFKSLEELLNVKNIGQATYDKIKDYFTI